ncbi:MAG: hypothetical protein ABJE95_04915 [Byssovorax sp.]
MDQQDTSEPTLHPGSALGYIKATLVSGWERANEISIMVVVQTVLALVWAAMLALMMVGVIFPIWGITPACVDRASAAAAFLSQSPATGALAGVVWLLCALPYPLSLCAALVVQQRAAGRKLYSFHPGAMPADAFWSEVLARVATQWDFEAERARDGVQRVVLYAGFLGTITSATLCLCAILLRGHLESVTAMRTALPLTVTSAVCASYAVSIARIVVRAAQRDGSGKMFAWATRSLLLSILGSMLFVLALAQSKESAFVSSTGGFIGVGIAVALVGEHFLQTLMERAGKLLGVAAAVKSTSEADIGELNGLSEEDIVRLAEEGIDNIHALAFIPTPRLYFSTTYSLQRICNWQDQAMLIVATDAKAATFRDQMMVFGAMDAQVLAERFLKPTVEKSEPTCFTADELKDLSTRLCFGTPALARVALHALAEDEVTRRLRVYNHGTVERDPEPARKKVRLTSSAARAATTEIKGAELQPG